jgi:hypothetical protein
MDQNFITNFVNNSINNSIYQNNDICLNNISSHIIDISFATLNYPYYPSLVMLASNMFRPINNDYILEDTSLNNTESNSSPYSSPYSSSYLQNSIFNSTTLNNIINDSSYITIVSTNNNYNNVYYPRAVSVRDLLRTLFMNYDEEDENNTFVETFINSTFETKEKFKKVISDNELEKLKPQKFNKINETTTNIECPILCYNFEENEEIIKLPCNHNYNCYAILKWLSEESNTCPVCRHEFDYKEINIDNKRHEHTDSSTQNVGTQNLETTSIHNLFSNEEILMQEILLNSYSNSNSNV